MSRGSTPRHAQTADNLGFAVKFNAETPWHFVQLRYSRVGLSQSSNRKANSIHSSVRDLMSTHAIAGYLRLPRPTPAHALMRVPHWLCC